MKKEIVETKQNIITKRTVTVSCKWNDEKKKKKYEQERKEKKTTTRTYIEEHHSRQDQSLASGTRYMV